MKQVKRAIDTWHHGVAPDEATMVKAAIQRLQRRVNTGELEQCPHCHGLGIVRVVTASGNHETDECGHCQGWTVSVSGDRA